MQNILKRTVIIALCIVLSLSLFSCNKAADNNTDTTETGNFPEVHDTLTWDKINAFPVADSSMSTDELRNLCVDFFRFSKTFAWTPDEDFSYIYSTSGKEDEVKVGTVYGGLPYVTLGSGNVYRTMDYYNPETGVMNMSGTDYDAALFGNQCSNASHWGWSRAVNSADFQYTRYMVVKNGYLRVGPYTYDDTLEQYGQETISTNQICEDNGVNTMYESYACLQKADGLVQYGKTAGHTIMCVENQVVRNDDGTINGEESYIILLEQATKWKELEQSNGDKFMVKTSVDAKWNYAKLLEKGYLPFTFAELLGTDTVEKSECTFSHTGETITVEQLINAKVESNYCLSDIYVILKDKKGKEVMKRTVRADRIGITSLDFDNVVLPETWDEYAKGKHTVEVIAQISTGERPTIYTGKLKN